MLDNRLKNYWDGLIMILLMFVTVSVPIRLAFYDSDDTTWKTINSMVDFCFLIDIVLCFFSSYLDGKAHVEIVDHKLIAINYLKTWFLPDVLSIVPIDYLLKGDSYN